MSNVSFEPIVADFDVSRKAWLAAHAKDVFAGVHSSAVIFDSIHSSSSPGGRMLLVQRSATDSMPGKWELPGGAVDDEDATILDGCARELKEETGLTALHVLRRITEGPGGEQLTVFTNSRGTSIFCKFVFEIRVDDGESIVLDPEEHQAWVWASEDEVVTGKIRGSDGVDGFEIPLTAPHVRRFIMEAFRLRKADTAQE